jgi:hypothetical protein
MFQEEVKGAGDVQSHQEYGSKLNVGHGGRNRPHGHEFQLVSGEGNREIRPAPASLDARLLQGIPRGRARRKSYSTDSGTVPIDGFIFDSGEKVQMVLRNRKG